MLFFFIKELIVVEDLIAFSDPKAHHNAYLEMKVQQHALYGVFPRALQADDLPATDLDARR